MNQGLGMWRRVWLVFGVVAAVWLTGCKTMESLERLEFKCMPEKYGQRCGMYILDETPASDFQGAKGKLEPGLAEASRQNDAAANASEVYAQEVKPKIAATFDLSGKTQINLDAGAGVGVRAITDSNSYGDVIRLTVEDQRQKIKEFGNNNLGRLTTLTRVEVGSSYYYILEVFTGGAHCCLVMHFFAKADQSQRLRYLGATSGREAGDGVDINKSLFIQNGRMFLEWEDLQFGYFHIYHAASQLFFPIFYRITPTSLTLDNAPFKDAYLKQVNRVENEIRKLAATKREKPATILNDVEKGDFSDELGQLLIKRTILYLYAGEEEKAWQGLATDLRKYYKSDKGLATLRSEIRKTMSTSI